ncbi:MAG: hypothetical protein IJC99_06450 [Clostridia bacterium]|nr:hypothetical protein [Clostridia bacterium]
MKNFVRVICLLLVCVFCLTAIIACNGKKRKRGTLDREFQEIDGVLYAKDEWGTWREYDSLPDDMDYDGDTVKVLYWTGSESVSPEFVQEELVDDDRLASIYKRNEAVQDRMNIELYMVAEPGDTDSMETFVKRVEDAKKAGTNEYDIVAAYSRSQGALLTKGLIQNLNAIEDSHLDLSKPWWPPRINDNLEIGKGDNAKLYYVSGDMAMTAIDNLHCVYFNKDLVDQKYAQKAKDYFANTTRHAKIDAENSTATYMLYDMAYKGGEGKGGWTIDDLIELSSNAYLDKNSSGVVDMADQFGLCSIGYCMAALYGGSNLRMVEQDVNSTLKVSDDWTSNRTVELINKLTPLMRSNSYCDNDKIGGTFYAMPFINGNALFTVYYLRMAVDYLIGNPAIEDYGILPIPKYNDAQLNYYTVIGNEFSIFSIFIDCDDRGDRQGALSMLTAVLECWASEAFRQTTPVVFEMNMQLKSSPTQAETDMCELIRANIQFDMGRIMDTALSGGSIQNTINMDSLMASAARNGTSWTTVTKANLDLMKGHLADFVSGLK